MSKEREILAALMAFTLETADGPCRFEATETETLKKALGVVERVTTAEGQAC